MLRAVTSVEGSRLTIEFAHPKLDTDAISDRLREVVPLVAALLSADAVMETLPEEVAQEKMRGFLAVDLLCQMAIQTATRQAEKLCGVADGSLSIADLGFPEFDGGVNIDV